MGAGRRPLQVGGKAGGRQEWQRLVFRSGRKQNLQIRRRAQRRGLQGKYARGARASIRRRRPPVRDTACRRTPCFVRSERRREGRRSEHPRQRSRADEERRHLFRRYSAENRRLHRRQATAPYRVRRRRNHEAERAHAHARSGHAPRRRRHGPLSVVVSNRRRRIARQRGAVPASGMPEEGLFSGVGGLTVDSLGYMWATSAMGIQVCEQPGRCTNILNKPEFTATPITSIAFGGPGRAWLYVTQGGKLFRRETKRAGVVAWEPVKPPQPGL